jgi:hypothetical protein
MLSYLIPGCLKFTESNSPIDLNSRSKTPEFSALALLQKLIKRPHLTPVLKAILESLLTPEELTATLPAAVNIQPT